ncbi:MAG: sulfurtransferase TusA family protein [Rhodobacteraceae bacterium]|jgi:tRNA 2-thiouridine synthesizing protein A|nr:sulfurtransferase TusA family protein [Paracoccaceae bacterium]
MKIVTLDTKGLLCPLPVLKARNRLKALAIGDKLEVYATDPAALIDIPHFCIESGHVLESTTEEDGAQIYLIRRS